MQKEQPKSGEQMRYPDPWASPFVPLRQKRA